MNLIGCHVSIAGGFKNAPKNAAEFECEAFQMFTRSPQGGPVKPIVDEEIAEFRDAMKEYEFTTFVVHAPYIINFASAKKSTYFGSIDIIRKDLERANMLGAAYVMFHIGSAKDLEIDEAMKQVKEGIVKVLDGYEGTTQLLLENSAGAGAVIGDSFEELAQVMEPLVKFKTFGGICYDTQHGFASGYDIRDAEAVKKTFSEFDKHIGLEYLKCFQINDSKTELGSHKDRHEHIADGLIGREGFGELLSYLKKKKITAPLIFETEHDKVKEDIETLKKLRNSK